MASQLATKSAKVCLMCLESRPLKIVGKCKHSFCEECLSATFDSQEGDVFSCPSCKAECPRPQDGAKGLVDFTGESVAVENITLLATKERVGQKQRIAVKKTKTKPKRKEGRRVEEIDVKCMICSHRKKKVQAINLCIQCGHLYMCKECTGVHSRNKATKEHVVVPLQLEVEEDDELCETHDSPLDSFCHGCSAAVCMICIMLDHGDHDVEKLEEVVDTKVGNIRIILNARKEKLKELSGLKYELLALKDEAPLVDKQDTLIKDVEDFTQEYIDKIIKWKEDFKSGVKDKYKIIRDVSVDLKKVIEVEQKLQEFVERADGLLAKIDHRHDRTAYLNELNNLQQDLDAIVEGEFHGTPYWDLVNKLRCSDYRFVPHKIPRKFGELDIGKNEVGLSVCGEILTLDPIYEHTMQTQSKHIFIPSVVILGKKFAVAHPARQGEPSVAIDIYEFPGTLERTIRDHVAPLLDMSATPDGNLAVLSNGTDHASCKVKLFDPESGYICSSGDISIAEPLSLGVTLRHQYIILGDNEEGQKQIVAVDKNWEEVDRRVLDDTDLYDNSKRITCGGRYIFITADDGLYIYETADTGLRCVQTLGRYTSLSTDSSATIWNDFCRVYIYEESNFGCKKWIMKNNDTEIDWICEWTSEDICEMSGADKEARISTRDGHMVITHGQTIKVYKV